jgi:hypothetical protein
MFEHHVKACEMNEAEEVFDVVFPSVNESAEVLHPCEEPFTFNRLRIAAACVLPFGIRGMTQSNYRMHQFRVSEVYETGSSLELKP